MRRYRVKKFGLKVKEFQVLVTYFGISRRKGMTTLDTADFHSFRLSTFSKYKFTFKKVRKIISVVKKRIILFRQKLDIIQA